MYKIMKNFYKIIVLVSAVGLPTVSYADEIKKLKNTGDILGQALGIVTDILAPMAFILALLAFFWGVFKYIRNSGNDKDEGKKIMFWGVIALFVMSSVWGLVYFIRGELGIIGISSVPIPTIQTDGGAGEGGLKGPFPEGE